MGCVFCASGLDGLNAISRPAKSSSKCCGCNRCSSEEERLSHIVVMGMGEPLANLDALLPALDEATPRRWPGHQRAADHDFHRRPPQSDAPAGRNEPPLSPRRFASCTERRTAAEDCAGRRQDSNRRSPRRSRPLFRSVRPTTDVRIRAAGRPQRQPAPKPRNSSTLLAGRTAMLNVIPYNPVAGLPYETPRSHAQRNFRQILEQGGVNVHFRHRKGDAIDAACGQLRRRAKAEIRSRALLTLNPQPRLSTNRLPHRELIEADFSHRRVGQHFIHDLLESGSQFRERRDRSTLRWCFAERRPAFHAASDTRRLSSCRSTAESRDLGTVPNM